MLNFIPIYICNYNTTELTIALIYSILKNLKSFDYIINVFDNSDKIPFKLDKFYDKINVIDNTNGKFIDFDKVVKENSNHSSSPNNHASLKHCYTIDYIIQFSCQNFLLFDSDTILKQDIDFIDDSFITCASVCKQEPTYKNKFYPFIQYFNVNLIKKKQY